MSSDLRLVSDYFTPSCLSCFTAGIPQNQQFVPPSLDDQLHDDNTTTTSAAAGQRVPSSSSPPCQCEVKGRGFHCDRDKLMSDYAVEKHRVVTGDWLLDVTGKAAMNEYLLYTTNMYR